MSTPAIPGFTEGPHVERLSELWARPEGDFPDELWPAEVLESVLPEPTGWLTVCEHFFTDSVHGGRACVLVSRDQREHAIGGTSWIGRDLGKFSTWYDFEDNYGFETGLAAAEQDVDLEFFVQVRQAVGSSEPIVELSQPFLWYWDAYPVRDGWAYLNEAGRPQELVRARVAREHWTVEVRALEFRQFLHTIDRDAVVQIDYVPKTRSGSFGRTDDRFINDWAHFDYAAVADRSMVGRPGFSRLLGQHLVQGTATSRLPRYHGDSNDSTYPEFIYGIDPSTGNPLRHTCDPDQLGTYFDEDNSRLHYLTPVYFRREVLTPYAAEPNRYELKRTRLACLNLWGVDISFNSAGLVEVYLGDIGERLPRDEWGHWQTYNVVPEGTMEEGRFKRDFLAQATSSPDAPGDVRRARARVAATSESIFSRAVWRDLGEDIAPEFDSMIGPLSEDPAALGSPLLLLTKCLVDAIDPTPLKSFLQDPQPGERSLALLARAVERLGGSADDVEPLRALHDFRSSGGVAHLAGSNRDAALDRLGIRGMTTIEAFDHVATRLAACLAQLAQLFEDAAG